MVNTIEKDPIENINKEDIIDVESMWLCNEKYEDSETNIK